MYIFKVVDNKSFSDQIYVSGYCQLSQDYTNMIKVLFSLEEKYKNKVSSIWKNELSKSKNFVLVNMISNNDLKEVLNKLDTNKYISTSFVNLKKEHAVYDNYLRNVGILYHPNEENFIGACMCDANVFDEDFNVFKDIASYPKNLESLCIYDNDFKIFAGILFNDCDEIMTKIKTPISLKRVDYQNMGYYNEVALLANKSKPTGVICYLYPEEEKEKDESYQEAKVLARHFNVPLKRVDKSLLI